MICEQYELIGEEVVTPMLQSSHNGVELCIVSEVVSPDLIQLLAEESHWVLILAQHCINPYIGGITLRHKNL